MRRTIRRVSRLARGRGARFRLRHVSAGETELLTPVGVRRLEDVMEIAGGYIVVGRVGVSEE